jgi:hypothetical protein
VCAPGSIYVQHTDESILLGLCVARDRWRGETITVGGPEQFQARVKALAEKHRLGMKIVLEQQKQTEKERPRPRGPGRGW